jgi:hypothetical protein
MHPRDSIARLIASRLLAGIARRARGRSSEWAGAMLAELDFVEGEWRALWWALGGATAILRDSGGAWRWYGRKRAEEKRMNDVGKKAIGVGEGIVLASALAVVAYGLLRLLYYFVPRLEDLGPVPWVAWLVVMGIPQTLFITFAIRLWNRKRPMAVGIVLTAGVFAVHFAVHIANHWSQ